MPKKENRTKSIEIRQFRMSIKIIFTLFCIFYSISTSAQCAMCRAALESEGVAAKNEALNDGIVYLMAIPYILVAIIGYIVYRMFSKKKTSKRSV